MSAFEQSVPTSNGAKRLPVRGLLAAGRKMSFVLLFAGLPIILIISAAYPLDGRSYGWDLRAFYNAGSAFLEHRSPYPPASLSALTSAQSFVYPLPAAAIFAPVAVLPFPVVLALFLVLSTGCIFLALRILDVRDPLCYGAAVLALPTQFAIKLGTLSPLLALGLALLWRFRDRRFVSAFALAALVVSKLFLWPIAVWLIATRRLKSAILSACLAVAAALLPLLSGYGFATYRDYPRLLHVLSNFESGFSFSVATLSQSEHLTSVQATEVAWLLGLILLAVSFWVGRSGNEFASFRIALAAAFVLSPIVWGHYFVLLLVPLAIAQPRFSVLWLALAWIPGGGLLTYQTHRSLLIVTAMLAAALQLTPDVWRGGAAARLARWLSRPYAQAAFAAVLAAALLLTGWTAQTGTTAVAALQAAAGNAGGADGTAFLIVERRRLCLQVWTENFKPRSVSARITRGGAAVAVPGITLDSDGKASTCSGLASSAQAILRATAASPQRFRLTLREQSRPSPELSGTLQDPLQPAAVPLAGT